MTITSTLSAPDAVPHPAYSSFGSTPDDEIPVYRPNPTIRRSNLVRISPYGPSDIAPTSDFERSFRHRLVELGAAVGPLPEQPKRSTITAVVTALRSGIDVDRFLGVARGLCPQDAADGYDYVEHLRSTADSALVRLIADPTIHRFERELELLAPYLPQMMVSLRRVAHDHPESFADAVAQLDDQSTILGASVDAIEDLVLRDHPAWPARLADLDDGRNQGVYHHVCYRPRRVGDIVPMRLGYLLGDSKQELRG